MFETLVQYAKLAIEAFSALFESLALPLASSEAGIPSIASELGFEWLNTALEFVVWVLEQLPDAITLFGDEILSFSFYTPLGELILVSSPLIFIAYALISWIIDIFP